MPEVVEQFPKKCTCCTRAYSREQWLTLPLKGEHVDEWQRDEYRNCASCDSTLVVVLEVFKPFEESPAEEPFVRTDCRNCGCELRGREQEYCAPCADESAHVDQQIDAARDRQ